MSVEREDTNMARKETEPANDNVPQKENSKSHIVLYMALIASFAVVALFVATYILLQIKFKEEIVITLSDWLKLILPIVGGAIVTIFAFLGVDRLKNFDERQDRLAKELRSNVSEQVDNAVKLVQPQLIEVYQEWEKNLKEKLTSYDGAFQLVQERIDKYDKIIGSVETLEEVSDAIGNVAEAHDFVAELLSKGINVSDDKIKRTRILLALIQRVKDEEIKGDCNDYYNLATALAQFDYYEFASDVTEVGLRLFRENADLQIGLAYYSHKAGLADRVEMALNNIDLENTNKWNWRTFTYYISIINDHAATPDNKEKALKCVGDYKRILPDDERAYMAEYQTYKKHGELDKAEKALADAEQQLAMTAQCSLALSKIYHMRGEYEQAILSATRAILSQAETQPSSDTGAAFAYRGFAKDAKVHKSVLNGANATEQRELILSAISDFEMARKVGYVYNNLEVRMKILKHLLNSEQQGEANSDIEERLSKLELTFAILLKKLTSDDEE